MRTSDLIRASVAAAVGALLLCAAAAAGSDPSREGDRGVLERFAPQSATTWWAVVQSNRTARSWLVRTVDSGRSWQEAGPPVGVVTSSAFVSAGAAWIEGARSGATQPLYRTFDGGRTWRRVGGVPSGCELDFVDRRPGWCIVIGGATGSETVRLTRTVDGGLTWAPVSRTGLYDSGSTSGALPFACDKTIAFTSPTVGWAAQYCAGGSPHLFVSRDGGTQWRALAAVPVPRRVRPPAGEGLSLPVVSGSHISVSVDVGGLPHGATVIATSRNGGTSWRTQFVPGPFRYRTIDLIDVRHWLSSDGTTLASTAYAGGHWHSWASTVRMKDAVGEPLSLRFLSPRLGFAIPAGNDGPLWWTRDGGRTWRPIRITAGPFTVPRS